MRKIKQGTEDEWRAFGRAVKDLKDQFCSVGMEYQESLPAELNPITHIAVCLCGAWSPVSLRSDKHESCPFCGYPSPALFRIGQQIKVRRHVKKHD